MTSSLRFALISLQNLRLLFFSAEYHSPIIFIPPYLKESTKWDSKHSEAINIIKPVLLNILTWIL